MRDKILQKAAELFLNYGFKSVTMDDIAKEMGISKKTIYANFKNKTQLVKASTHHIFEIISQGIDHICSLNNNPIEELFKIKTFVMKHLKNDKSSPQFQLQKYYPSIYASIKKKQFDIMQDCVTQNLSNGIKLGLYRQHLPLEFISRIYFLGISGIKDETLFSLDLFKKKDLMNYYLEYHIRGIATKKGIHILQQILKSNDNE